ncbi:MAG: MerR family transcriptional regulator [Micrococcales bacterium]|nr:MerR family transcriptional regulator [Micrococcales bacterium]
MTWHTPASAAQATGLSLDALRYYEREGLIGPVDRDAGGRRRYSDDDLAWIGLITCLRDAGLGIADLRRFTTLLRQSADPSDRVTFLREREAELRERLRQTQAALDVLGEKIAHFSSAEGQ